MAQTTASKATANKATKAQAPAAPAPGTVAYTYNAAAAAKLRAGSARANTAALASQHTTQAALQAAWQAAQQAGNVHHTGSKWAQGTNKAKETFGGWWGWLVRSGIVTVQQ